jgi:hydroxypyruvate reductase
MVSKSRVLGFKTILSPVIQHDVVISAKKLVKMIPKSKSSCIVFGGEPTVNLKGKGKGGRNQELVLQILKLIHKSNRGLIISSIGTDGIDGNTKYAGALVENNSFKQEDIIYYLKNNNSNLFFKKYDGLIKTGYTHTNLMDFGLILKY